jgi:hypothetical protein
MDTPPPRPSPLLGLRRAIGPLLELSHENVLRGREDAFLLIWERVKFRGPRRLERGKRMRAPGCVGLSLD